MAALIRAFVWNETPLGPIAGWSESLLATVNLMLGCRFPAVLFWGPELVQFYNDAYLPLMAEKHPAALGQRAAVCWAEAWHIIGPQIEATLTQGISFFQKDVMVPLLREGRLEEVFWTYSYSPVFDGAGGIGGVLVVCQDVTGEVLAARERDAATQSLNQVLDATTDGVLSIDRNWCITFLNMRGREAIAASGEVIGKNFWESFPRTIYEGSPFEEHYRRAMEERIAGQFEAFYPEPLNAWFTVTAQPSREGIVIFFRDVTAARWKEQTRRENELKLKLATDAAGLGIFIWYVAEDRVTWENDSIYAIFGRDPADGSMNAAQFVAEALHAEDTAAFARAIAHTLETGVHFFFQGRFVRRDGAEGWVEFTGLLEYEGDREPWRILGTALDITARQRSEEHLRESEARLKIIYDTTHEYIGLLTPEGVVVDCNRASLAFAGNRRRDVIGMRFWETPWFAYTPEAPARLREAIARAVAGESVRYEAVLLRPSGEATTFDFAISPIFDEAGKVKFLVPEGRDITELKRAETALLQNEKLAAVGRLAASIAHEINNPLESVTNLLYLARGSKALPEVQEYLDTAERELRRVSVIANQTLRFYKQSTRPRLVSCGELIDGVLSMYHGRLLNSGVRVEKRKRATRGVLCFEGEMRQVLTNLIGNAIDALHPTGGRLVLRSRDACDWATGRRGLGIAVADTGSGIGPDAMKKIFQAFFTTKGIGGTGLGLWLSQEIVHRHNGRLRVRSRQQPGASGTVFTLFLPYEAAVR